MRSTRTPSPKRGNIRMNKDIIAGKWTQLKGQAQAKWGDLTDDVFDVQKGDSEYLAGKLQEQYGWDRDRAESEVRDFETHAEFLIIDCPCIDRDMLDRTKGRHCRPFAMACRLHSAGSPATADRRRIRRGTRAVHRGDRGSTGAAAMPSAASVSIVVVAQLRDLRRRAAGAHEIGARRPATIRARHGRCRCSGARCRRRPSRADASRRWRCGWRGIARLGRALRRASHRRPAARASASRM